MNATFSQPRPLAPLATRRRLVLMALGGYVFFLLTVALSSLYDLPDILSVPFALLGLLLCFTGGLQLLKPSRLGLPEGHDRRMDERQWQQLAQAHITAYRVLGLLLIAGSIYLYAASGGCLPFPSSSYAWLSVYLGAVIFIPALPTAILAWTEPHAGLQGE